MLTRALLAGALSALAFGEARAQDVILKKDQSRLNTKVVEITDEHIKYRLFDFQDGPIYNIRKTEVSIIFYEKGRREQFNAVEGPAVAAAPATPAAPPAPEPAPAPVAAPTPVAAEAPAAPAPIAIPAAPAPTPAEPEPATAAAAPSPAASPAAPAAPDSSAAVPATAVADAPPAAPAAAPAEPAVEKPAPAPAVAQVAAAPVASKPAAPAREPLPAVGPGGVLWAKPLQGYVQQKYINPDGNILVIKPNVLQCISRTTGAELWHAAVDQAREAYLLGEGNLLEVRRLLPGAEFTTSFVVDTRSGKVVYSPTSSGRMGNRVVSAANVVVWETTPTSTRAVILDRYTGATLGDFPIANTRVRSGNVVERPDGKLCFFTANQAIVFDPAAGKLLYKAQLKKSSTPTPAYLNTTFSLFETDKPNQVTVILDGCLTSLDLETGQVVGEKDLQAYMVTFHALGQNQLLLGCPTSRGLDLHVVNLNTCQTVRSNTVNIGSAVAMQHHGNDLFVVNSSTFGGTSVKLVDLSTLTLKADKTFRTGSIYFAGIFDTPGKGIGVADAGSVQFFDPQTYALTSKTQYYVPVAKAKLVVNDDTYFYANGYLGRFNQRKGEEALLLPDKLVLKLQENEVADVEVTDDGVVLVGAQNLAKVDFKGNLVYNQYFASPGPSAGSVIGNGLLLAASAALAVESGTQASAANSMATRQDWASKQRTFESAMNGAGERLRAKYSRSENTRNHQIILTKAEAGGSRFRLIKFNKSTGKIDGQVNIDSRSPDYVYDAVDSVVYLFDSGMVRAYKI